jgi:hypothetical protein
MAKPCSFDSRWLPTDPNAKHIVLMDYAVEPRTRRLSAGGEHRRSLGGLQEQAEGWPICMLSKFPLSLAVTPPPRPPATTTIATSRRCQQQQRRRKFEGATDLWKSRIRPSDRQCVANTTDILNQKQTINFFKIGKHALDRFLCSHRPSVID